MPYTLSYKENGILKRTHVRDQELTIGRAPDCGMVLAQAGISRHHCKITESEGQVSIEDLNSKNGTRINGIYIKTSSLDHSDIIQVGEFALTFEVAVPETKQQMVVLSEDKGLYEEAGTIIRRVNELKDIIAEYESLEIPPKAKRKGLEGSKQIMTVLIDVAKALIEVKSLSEIIQRVMDLIFEHLPADRGFLMLSSDGTNLEPRVIKHRDPSKADNIEISKTIAEKVFHEDVAILTTDAQVDPRFSAGESIRFLGIKSAMCVPLFHKNKTIGIIYLDSPTSAAVFGPRELDMLTAMANFAAVGIEQAQLTEKIERESKIRHRLERYHSPSIVSRILESTEPGALSGEYRLSVQEREVTVLFADVVGFTPMSERMAPAKIAHLLNDYFSAMTEVIFHYEGTLDKYIGDAIMAIFGAPNVMRDHPRRAVLTALGMLAKLNEINRNRPEEEQFHVRIGINTGRAVAGDIGSLKRMEYTVLGNTVNLASRIESMACQPNQVTVGESTYQFIKDNFVCQNLGPIRLKGITEETTVYRIIRQS